AALNEQIKHVRAHPPSKGGLKVVLRIAPEGWEVPRDSFFQNNFFLLPELVRTVRGLLRADETSTSRTVSPLTPALSPLRGEGESAADAAQRARRSRFLIDAYCGVGFFSIELADLVEHF